MGTALIQVAGDRKRRQAVINVTEQARHVTRSFVVQRIANRQLLGSRLLADFPVFIPNAAGRLHHRPGARPSCRCDGDGRGTSPNTRCDKGSGSSTPS
ncbi:MAG: hypothetical protein ACRDYC_07785 [Acidimicrobiales bacterium]